jgi:hypothetical protein
MVITNLTASCKQYFLLSGDGPKQENSATLTMSHTTLIFLSTTVDLLLFISPIKYSARVLVWGGGCPSEGTYIHNTTGTNTHAPNGIGSATLTERSSINTNTEGKGKVPVFSLTEHQAVKAYWGSGYIAPSILDLGTRWRWVDTFTPRPLYPQGRSPR